MPVENARCELLVQGTIVGTAVLGVVGNVLLEALRPAQRWPLRSSRVAEVAGQLRDLMIVLSAILCSAVLSEDCLQAEGA